MNADRFTSLEMNEGQELKKKKPKITEVSFKRIYNLGNYETIAIELKALTEEDSCIQDTLKDLEQEADTYIIKRG